SSSSSRWSTARGGSTPQWLTVPLKDFSRRQSSTSRTHCHTRRGPNWMTGICDCSVAISHKAAAILLCIVTELQAHFHFDGANIDERIHKIWNALMPAFAVKQLYSERYEQLMKDKGINP